MTSNLPPLAPELNDPQSTNPGAPDDERLDELIELITRVRHEINNPLTGVLGQAQLLLREEITDGARKRVETIAMLAERIRDIVATLRDVQRAQKRPDYNRPFNSNEDGRA